MVYFGGISDSCATILGVVYFIRELLELVCIIIPIGLIIMLSLDFMKGVISVDDGKNKVMNYVIKRIIYAVVIFLLPSTIFGLFNILGLDPSDSTSCWAYVNEASVEEVKKISSVKEQALIDSIKDAQEELAQKLKKRNAISSSKSSNTTGNSSGTGTSPGVTGSKKCTSKEKIRLTSFNDKSLRNSVKKGKVGTTNKNFKTYTYNGKEYIVIATAMKKTDWENPVSSYNFKDYDVLTLEIEGQVYDAIVLDVCGACADSTNRLKIDLWTTDDNQWWSDIQYICTD